MKLATLEKKLGYKFASIALLTRALTHSSWPHENLPGADEIEVRDAVNESLEFVGDAVLGLVVAESVFLKFPTVSEGDLSRMKHRLVSTPTLAAVGRKLKLGAYLRLGRSEENTAGGEKPAILADAVEAVIAAVFFDGGYAAARDLIYKLFADELKETTAAGSADYKSTLQEILQANKMPAPTYSLLRSEGPPHARHFFVEAKWDGGKSEGSGNSLKSAEMMAASVALKSLDGQKLRKRKTAG
ncbi:MAG: ribonuclease III [Acidobacteria bacterium]|nr:ribonuclease III [Acidobacteriota bacterium]MCA1608869.1 ribonuclease III [Acidobacteriota bacterium]